MMLRTAAPADVPTLAALGRESFVHAFGHLYSAQDLAAFLDEYRAPEKFVAAIASPAGAVTVAEEGGALLAYCIVYFDRGFPERPEPIPERPAMLSQLYAARQATGRGVGSALLEIAIRQARARGCDAMQLSVYSENFGAQRLYARHGFIKVADIDFWVGNHRDDELLYELRL